MLEEGNALIGWVHVAVPCPLGSLRPRPRSQPPRPLPSICEHALLLSEVGLVPSNSRTNYHDQPSPDSARVLVWQPAAVSVE